MSAAVILRQVAKGFEEGGQRRVVLDTLDAEVGPGEIIALYGPSGSGKSTLLNLMSGVDLPDAGSIEIAGVAISALDERARTIFRRRRIGFVFQFFNLLPTLTVRENVLLRLALDRRDDAPARAYAAQLLTDVGLLARADSFPDRLSGGEQQRVAVVAALAHRPELVLADEPTGNLDADNAARVLALMERLVRATGSAMVIATHSQEVARIADRTWTMSRGRVV
jgi:putative ABC transport system ATP-binding protein